MTITIIIKNIMIEMNKMTMMEMNEVIVIEMNNGELLK